jgi:DNA-directed RNA polymerase subunit E'/Rpb7
MQTSVITRRVTLNPKYLTKNIKNHIITQLQIDTKNDCSKQFGHILKIIKIEEILDNENTTFVIKFSAETLKPEKDRILEGKVFKVYRDGIFIDVMEKQKILIPALNLTNYEFNEDNDTYVSKNKEIIQENDEVKVKIVAVKYNKGKFSCFGSLA